jgi:hypothetical protein
MSGSVISTTGRSATPSRGDAAAVAPLRPASVSSATCTTAEPSAPHTAPVSRSREQNSQSRPRRGPTHASPSGISPRAMLATNSIGWPGTDDRAPAVGHGTPSGSRGRPPSLELRSGLPGTRRSRTAGCASAATSVDQLPSPSERAKPAMSSRFTAEAMGSSCTDVACKAASVSTWRGALRHRGRRAARRARRPRAPQARPHCNA